MWAALVAAGEGGYAGSPGDVLAAFDGGSHRFVGGADAARVGEGDDLAVAHPAGEGHHAVGGGQDGCAGARGQVDAPVTWAVGGGGGVERPQDHVGRG